MLKRDHRLKHGAEVFDHARWTATSAQAGEDVQGTPRGCIRNFKEMGMLYDLARRVEPSTSRTGGGCRNRKVLNGRFIRGRCAYVLAEDRPCTSRPGAASPPTCNLDGRVLQRIRDVGQRPMRELAEHFPEGKEAIKESLDRLDRNMYLVRRFEEVEDWSRENTSRATTPRIRPATPGRRSSSASVRAYGPVPPRPCACTPASPPEWRRWDRLEVERIAVGETAAEMVLMADELPALRSFVPEGEGGAWSA